MAKYSYDDLSYEYLHKVLSYDSGTGDFYHKTRPKDMFKTEGSWKSWNTKHANKKAGHLHKTVNGHLSIIIRMFYKPRGAHRIAWFMHYGEWPKDQIDHINGDATDNRIENLRDVSNQENQRNKSRQSRNTSGVTGVHWHKRDKKWIARIKVDKKDLYIGMFDTFEEAVAARKEAEIKYGFHENHGRERVNAEGE